MSTASFIADVGTDVIVIIQYYINHHYSWMLLTLGLVCVPSFLVQIFSIRWYIIDGMVNNTLWIIHILQLGIFNRYIELFRVGFRVRKSDSELRKFNQQQSDLCMLRLFESFMESAPQLVLQLYIMMSTEDWNPWTGISATASVFSLSWGIAAYSKAMRNVRPEKKHVTWWGLIVQSLWRIGSVSSRVIAMVLFAVTYGPWLILVMFFHWVCMTFWVISQKTDFCNNLWEERLYNCIVGVIYCFCFFNLKEGRSRRRIATFYSLTSIQNICFVLAYYFSEQVKSQEIPVILVFAGMLVGLANMLLYYRFFHPTGSIPLHSNRSEALVEGLSKITIENCSTLKTCRKPNLYQSSAVDPSTDEPSVTLNDHDISVLSNQSNFMCLSNVHRTHSLNCKFNSSAQLIESIANLDDASRVGLGVKSYASHYRNVNYNFRTAVAFGHFLDKFHCSCLVLSNKQSFVPQRIHTIKGLASVSLPNLKTAEKVYDSYDSDDYDSSSSFDVFQHSRSTPNFLSLSIVDDSWRQPITTCFGNRHDGYASLDLNDEQHESDTTTTGYNSSNCSVTVNGMVIGNSQLPVISKNHVITMDISLAGYDA